MTKNKNVSSDSRGRRVEKSKKLLIDTGDTLNKLRENNSEKLEKYIELLKEYYKQENKKERE